MHRAWLLVALAGCSLSWPGLAAAQPTILPEWMGRELDVWSGSREAQIPDREALFRGAPRGEATLEDDVLICRVHVSEPSGRRWDLFADPDLRAVLSVGSRRAVVWGSENSRTETFSFPGVTLRRGSQLSLRVVDRDVTTDELIGNPRGRFDGRLPLSFESSWVEVECRAPRRDAIRARLSSSLERAEASIVVVERATPDLADASLGRPTRGLDDARRALLAAMAYAGSRAPVVRAPVRRLEAAERDFDRRLARAIADARRSATSSAAVDGIEVEVEAWTCDATELATYGTMPERSVCAVKLRWEGARAPALGVPDAIDAHGARYTSSAQLDRQAGGEHGAVLVFRERVPFSQSLLRIGRQRVLLRP